MNLSTVESRSTPPVQPARAEPAAPPARTGREIVDAHTRGTTTDIDAVAAELKQQIAQRPAEATVLMRDALEQLKVDDRDEVAQEFVRAHSDAELRSLGQSPAGKGALALAVNELAQGSVHGDEADDAKRVGDALGVAINLDVNAGFSWQRVSGAVHTVLDVAGFIPGLGAIPDLINAGIYAAEGNLGEAAFAAGAAVPLFGDAAKGGRIAARAGSELLQQGVRHADDVGGLTRHVDEGLAAATRQGGEAAAATTRQADEAATRTGANTPNVTVTHNGYTYRTDAQGRVNHVSGDLTLNKAQTRNQRAQSEAGGSDRLPDDQGGHFVGRQFDGPREAINHFAQNGNFNMGAYRSLERSWDRLLQDGRQVRVEITPRYDADSLRPSQLTVRQWIDGVPQRPLTFGNQRGGQL